MKSRKREKEEARKRLENCEGSSERGEKKEEQTLDYVKHRGNGGVLRSARVKNRASADVLSTCRDNSHCMLVFLYVHYRRSTRCYMLHAT